METKRNTFRDEVAVTASVNHPAEEMKRNQAVHLFHLQAKKAKLALDSAHLKHGIELLANCLLDVEAMPDCECKEGTIGVINQEIEQHKKAMANCEFNGISEMTLDALERLANLTASIDAENGAVL
jgi:hypothetical protein